MMNEQPERVFSFDMSDLVQKSVATLYSHLITRPTGKAIRLGIESQLCEHGGRCVCVLDFTQVVILDYSCADEAVAKLIQRFHGADRPADAYFIAKGLAEQHREPLEEVLIRHGLVLVADAEGVGNILLGAPSMIEQLAFAALELAGFATAAQLADGAHHTEAEVASALESLTDRRALVPSERPEGFFALTALLAVAG
ncbi:MAG: hypothetical protein ABIV28_04565 [Longimicrobiales bacterium]